MQDTLGFGLHEVHQSGVVDGLTHFNRAEVIACHLLTECNLGRLFRHTQSLREMIDVLESMLVCLVNWEGWSLGLQIEVNESTGTRLDRPLGSKGRVLCLVPGGDLTVRHRLLVVIGEVFAVRLPCSLEIIVFSTMHKGRWSTICNRVVLFLYKVFGKHVTLTVSPGVRGAICSVLESGVDFDRGVLRRASWLSLHN